MLVFWKENLVFLSVPKTGTTAMQAALAPRADMVFRGPPQIKHAPLYRYNRFLRPYYNKAGGQNPETLAVIRHPVEWLSSWYRYRNRNALVGHPNSTRNVDFDAFVLEYCKPEPATFAKVGTQAAYVYANDGVREVTHLYRYEAQPKVIAFLEDRLKLTLALPTLNVSPTIPAKLSPDVAQKLLAAHPREFAAWDQAIG